MKFLLNSLALSLLLLTACTENSNYQEYRPLSESPGPSDEDDPLRDSLKQAFFDQLYFAEEGLNVDSIRHLTWQKNYEIKQIRKRLVGDFRVNSEQFAEGRIEAIWHERGPNNEAGDVKVIDYVPSLNRFYVISSVGHLWTGTPAGDDWVLLNDDIQFAKDFIKVLPHGGGTRIFAAYGPGTEDKEVRYSDDEGQTWTKGTGFDFYDHWGAGRRLYALSDGMTLYYLVHTWSGSPWGQLMQIYKSTDKGETYTQVLETSTGYANETMDMWKPYDSDSMFVVDNVSKEYFKMTHNFGSGNTVFSPVVSYANQGVDNGGIHVSGRYDATASRYGLFICHDNNNKVYQTTNGSFWKYLSTSSDNVWRKGWLADPNTDNLYVGSFQLNKTSDLTNWEEQYGQWWEYYGSSKDSMHVDIMSLDYFEKANGTPFITICNHAGVHITYDNFHTTQNLAWTSLNVTTLYDQSTASDGFLYCGAQDKGTFVYDGNSQQNYNSLNTQNTTTGDGMIGSFFNNDNSYYSMIQNGQFACVPDRSSSYKSWYTIPGNHKSGWINPMVATPNFSDNKAYMAGGNLSGGNGSYLIEMNVNISSGISFNPTQFNYNFRSNSNSGSSVIKAIGVAMNDENRIYVATEDATFFYSQDAGSTWTKSTASLPSSMIPWEIITSDNNADLVIISGTGFSNPGVYMSIDGGDSFTPLITDIPAATFFEVILSDSEEYLFAATSEGPYVYSFEEAQWYDLIGADTPILDFTSVDNIGNSTIRFGTYGRGVWDLELVSVVLPVELVAFEAKLTRNSDVQLNWSTASEFNVNDFEVQYSDNGIDFSTIGTVTAGNSTYSFLHEKPASDVNFYRLKINNTDGKIEYSEIRVIYLKATEVRVALFPNPVRSGEGINLEVGKNWSYDLSIFDQSGRLVFVQNSLNGYNNIQPNLPKGIYFYQVQLQGLPAKSGKLVVM
jgi:hypothetical protein